MVDSSARGARHGDPRTVVSTSAVIAIVEDLHAQGIVVVPVVVADLLARVQDPDLVREVIARLSPVHRHGHRSLPSPLPLVDSAEVAGHVLVLDAQERDLLIAAALCTDGRLDIIAGVIGVAQDELSEIARGRLQISAGAVRIRDSRIALWIRADITPDEATAMHRRLRDRYDAVADAARSAWHAAKAATVRTPQSTAVLLPIARQLAAEGRSEAAFHVAVEAFHHADGADADAARVVAGEAALCAGWVADAVDWLGSLYPSGALAERESALAALVIAETTLRGALPLVDPRLHRPDDDDPGRWRSWARASGMAAVLCAERGADAPMRMWLAEVRAADARAGADGALRGPALAMCWLLTGDDAEVAAEQLTLTYGIAGALRRALDGDIAAGLDLLARHEAGLEGDADPFLHGFERTPLAGAYRAVTDVLLRLWLGDVAAARDRMRDVLVNHPAGLPFAGLGIVLARRLDLAVDGRVSPFVDAAARSLPAGIRIDGLVDRAIGAHLQARTEDAAHIMRIWRDRGAPALPLEASGLHETGFDDEADAVGPADLLLSARLHTRIRTTAQSAWQREYPDIAERARGVRSAFARGRVEALLGTTAAIRGDRAAGRRHLLVAHSLLTDAGAEAWRRDVARRLERLGERIEATGELVTVPIPVSPADPLAACHAAWAPMLTDRELQVALQVVSGATNREIAERLDVSVRTVEVHVGRIMAKLDVRNRVELAVLGHRTTSYG